MLCLALLCPFLGTRAAAAQETEYLTTAEAFSAALARREPVIYVDDITFSGGWAYIPLNYNVRIEGKPEGSTLTGVHFEVVGQITAEPGNNVTVDFENLRFDGGVDAADYDLTRQAPFADIFGSDRERECCVHASFGYFDVSFSNCEFTRYAAHRGAAVYCDNSIDFPVADRSITFTDCQFYGNIVQYGTCDIFGDRLITMVTDCEFTGNYAMGQAGMNITNGEARLTNVHVHDNHFLPYDAPEDQLNPGGGMRLGALDVYAQGLVIENNTAYWGGGLALVSAKSGNKEIVLSDCRIAGNAAVWGGGALHINSLQGQPIYFRNCEFADNTAPLGGSLYAVPYASWNGKHTAGLIDFTFCTFTGNAAEDDAAFSFYEMQRPEQSGTIALHGCLVTDEAGRTSAGEAPDYTLIGTAVEDAKDLRIPQEAYAKWSQGAYANVKRALAPGYNELLSAKSERRSAGEIASAIPTMYGICAVCSLLLLLGYLSLCKRRELWLLLLLAAACVVNIGYFSFSVSGSLPSALTAHRIAYFGNAFQPVLMLLTVGSVCRLRHSRVTAYVLLGLAAAMYACSATVGFSPLFYKSVSYGVVNGVVTLTKEYGPLHTLYQAYVLGVFTALLGIALLSVVQKKMLMPRYIVMTVLAVSSNLMIWLIGRLIRTPYELLSFSYIITGLLLILIYHGMAEDDLLAVAGSATIQKNEAPPFPPLLADPPVPAENEAESQRAACERLVAQKTITRREGDVLLLLLRDKNRAEIAAELHITENTVKTHTANVYGKLKVSSRTDLARQISALTEALR